MNKEEKEAIEKLKKQEALSFEELKEKVNKEKIADLLITRKTYTDTLLNLIDKLQKEIEHKQETIDRILKELEEFYEKYDVISKEKIRNKIKELEDMKFELTDEQGYWGKLDIEAQIEVLEELLGDE